MGITLTEGQQTAYEDFAKFILSDDQTVFVLEGYSGTGKTTLVERILEFVPKLLEDYKTAHPTNPITWEIALTATTNKAAEAFSHITGEEVRTIHSTLGLRVHKDFKTGITSLKFRGNAESVFNTILFIDEASYIDKALLSLIFEGTEDCKIVFIGDPAQLLTVGCTKSPVFGQGFPTAKLTEVVRQAKGNPIIELATEFRNTVNTGDFFSFVPDGVHIQVLDRDTFEAEIIKEFDDPTWVHNRSKVLAWTNKTVIQYNHAIRDVVKGAPDFIDGDYAICNSYVAHKKGGIKTDQLVCITDIEDGVSKEGVPGRLYTLDHEYSFFMPINIEDKKALQKQAKAASNYKLLSMIDGWIDLRAAYACTINKAQGSTYDKVFIDLDDIKKCNSGNQIARMLYVGVSRARLIVYLCGDLI
jgi:hypothetical protein